MADNKLPALYGRLKVEAKRNLAGSAVADLLVTMALAGHESLRSKKTVALRSKVPGKTYFSYRSGARISRPINKALWVPNLEELEGRLGEFRANRLGHLQGNSAPQTLYTLAMAFCAANDVLKSGDKKTPATYFEILVGHLFSVHLGITPTNSIEVLTGDMKGSLPTDFIFDLGAGQTKYHVPIKLSTRERVIQVWAHQRVVNGIYGVGRYKGVMVCLTETKLDTKKLEVIEITLPDQWKVYQMYIAQLARIYYLDTPDRYAALAEQYPKIEVKPLAHFFSEAATL